MTRAGLIRLFVLNSMTDDYEDIVQIMKATDEDGPRCGLTISREDVIHALRELIETGYADAWDLYHPGTLACKEYEGMPPTEEITSKDPAFSRTAEGLAFQNASLANGPFDENRNLHEGWLASSRREEMLRLFVLDSFGKCTHLCLVHLDGHSKSLAEQYGIAISRDEIIQALGELIGFGYLKASFERGTYRKYDGMPPLEDIKPFGAYFWVTGAGMDFHTASDSLWPFKYDDDGESTLREDWVPPQD